MNEALPVACDEHEDDVDGDPGEEDLSSSHRQQVLLTSSLDGRLLSGMTARGCQFDFVLNVGNARSSNTTWINQRDG